MKFPTIPRDWWSWLQMTSALFKAIRFVLMLGLSTHLLYIHLVYKDDVFGFYSNHGVIKIISISKSNRNWYLHSYPNLVFTGVHIKWKINFIHKHAHLIHSIFFICEKMQIFN